VPLIELRSVEDVSDSEIRQRLHNKAQYTREYVLREGTLEIGFLSFATKAKIAAAAKKRRAERKKK